MLVPRAQRSSFHLQYYCRNVSFCLFVFVFFLHKNKLFSDNLGTPGFA